MKKMSLSQVPTSGTNSSHLGILSHISLTKTSFLRSRNWQTLLSIVFFSFVSYTFLKDQHNCLKQPGRSGYNVIPFIDRGFWTGTKRGAKQLTVLHTSPAIGSGISAQVNFGLVIPSLDSLHVCQSFIGTSELQKTNGLLKI